jgi:excisionase family DNA binding protein
MDKTELLTIDEMATRLKVHPSWIYSRTRETGEGTIPRIKVGKYIRFNESDVFEWLSKKQDEA